MTDNLEKMKQAEAVFFDKSARHRTVYGQIPMEADIRRATRFIPSAPDQEPIDPKMTQILDGSFRDRFIDYVAHRPGGRVLDICCGPGWLALELGRRGQIVDGYDLSPEAIALAKRMLDENPYKDGFGNVTYHLADVTNVDLGIETFNAVSGWSAFHHLHNLPAFMDRVHRSLKPGGIVATLDDLPSGRISRSLRWAYKFLLPVYERTYPQKLKLAIGYLTRRQHAPAEVFSPMELVAAKHTMAVCDIESIWREKFELVWSVQFDAFATGTCKSLIGPDWFRYTITRAIAGLDRLLCKVGICRGAYRILIARKR